MIETFFSGDNSVTVYKGGNCKPDGKYVLYWMQRAQRASDNKALTTAIHLANYLQIPVVVAFCLTKYPAANRRHYSFMLEGLDDVVARLRDIGIPFIIRLGDPSSVILTLARQLNVAVIVSDENPLKEPRQWRSTVQQNSEVPFICVDADVVVPSKHFPKEEWAAYTIRPKIQKLLPLYLHLSSPTETLQNRLDISPINRGYKESPIELLCNFDSSISIAQFHKGGQSTAEQLLDTFIQTKLQMYHAHRSFVPTSSTSQLSPYLHFGQISVVKIAQTINNLSNNPTLKESCTDFLEELIVRRELAINFTLRNNNYDQLIGCPSWAIATLNDHRNDIRNPCYTIDQFEAAQTHDSLWNACQHQMIISGHMHGYLRIYWAKKILEWSDSPETAFEIAIYLNDKYLLDGRDANGYTGIAGAIGGKHDRAWPTNWNVFGKLRYISIKSLQKKMAVWEYINQWNTQA